MRESYTSLTYGFMTRVKIFCQISSNFIAATVMLVDCTAIEAMQSIGNMVITSALCVIYILPPSLFAQDTILSL